MRFRTIAAALLLASSAQAAEPAIYPAAFDRDFFYPKIVEPAATPAADRTEAQRQDLADFRSALDLELAFSPEARAEANRRADALAAKAGQLSAEEFQMALARIVALADNGHSRVTRGVQADGQPYPRLPFLAMPFAEGYCITRARSEAADLLGACLVAIDGVPMDTVAARLRDVTGGSDAHARVDLVSYLPIPALLHAEHIAKRADQVELTIKTAAGETKTRIVKAVAGDKFTAAWTALAAMPKPANADEGWDSFLRSGAELPLYLRHPGQPFVAEVLPDQRGYYLQLKVNTNADGVSITDFMAKAKAEMERMKPAYVVVDLRFNTGGDLTTTAATFAHLREFMAPGGHVYVLTNNWTFSAAITGANILKQAAGALVVGEAAGDRQRFWAEGSRTCLPNSKACVSVTRGLHDYAKGCTGELGCYYDELAAAAPKLGLVPLSEQSISPDIAAPLTFSDYAAGRDRALDMITSAESPAA